MGIGTVWEIHEECSQMEDEVCSPQADFGTKCNFFTDQYVNLIGAVVALPASKASCSYCRLSAWWRIIRKGSQGNNEGKDEHFREGLCTSSSLDFLPWVATGCPIAFPSRTGWFHCSDSMAWHKSCLGNQPLRTKGRCFSLILFRGKRICCKSMDNLKGPNVKFCLELVSLVFRYFQ